MPVEIASAYVSIIPTFKGLDSKLNDMFGGIAKQGDKAGTDSGDSFLGGFKGKALAGIAGVGLAVGAAFTDAMAEAMDVKKTQAKLQASLGISADQAGNLGKTAGRLYSAGYGESIADLTEQVGSVQSAFQNLKLPDDQLEKLTGKALSFTQAFGGDVESVAQNVNTLLGSGLTKNADEAFDLLTKASQKVPAALRGDIADASDEYSQFFRTLGFSGNEAFDALVKGADKGTFGIDKTGDAIKEFTIRSTDMSKSSVDAFTSIGLDAKSMTDKILAGGDSAKGAFNQITDGILSIQDPAAQSQAALALFGTPLEDMNVQDIPEFLKGLKGMSGGMGDAAGAADAMDKAMGSTSSGIDLLWRNIKTNLVEFINDKVLPAVSAFTSWLAEKLTPVINEVVTWLGDHLGPVLQKVADFFVNVLLPAGMQAWSWFEENLLPTVQRIGEFIGNTFGNLFDILGGFIDFIAGVFTGDWSRAWDGIKEIFSGIWAQIQNIVTTAWDVLTGVGGKILDWLSGLPGWAWDRISAFGSFLVEKGAQFLQWIWDGITTKATEVWDWFTALPQTIWDKVTGFVGAGGQWMLDRGSDFIGWVKDGIVSGAEGIWSFFTDLPNRIWNGLLALKDKILQIGKDFIGWIVDGVKAVAGDIWNAITDALSGNNDGRPDDSLTGANLPGVVPGGIAKGGLVARAGGGMMEFLGAENQYGRNWVQPNGFISGPGGPTQDLIPTWLSDGEYVNRAASVDKYFPALDALNSDKPEKAMWALLPHLATGGYLGTQARAKELGGELAWGYANRVIDDIKNGTPAQTSGFNSSQDPSSFGWQRAQGIVPFSWNGHPFVGGVADGTQKLWMGLLNALVPQIPGGLIGPIWAYENRQNVNSPGNASFHSYGLAADINAAMNPNGAAGYGRSGQGVIPAAVAHSLAAKFGMEWGGDFRGTPDPMHFEIHLSPQSAAGTGGAANLGGAVSGITSSLLSKLGLASGSAAADVGGSGVERWRPLGLEVLRKVGAYKGLDLTPFIGNMMNQIRTESSGDPNAINNYDINAQRGDPSIGLLQAIGSTFRNALRGTPFEYLIARGQRDPEASLTASTLYSLARYGSLDRAWQGKPYDTGGWLTPGGQGINLLNKPEAVLTPAQSDAYVSHAKALEAGYAGQAPLVINFDNSDPLQVAIADMIRTGVRNGHVELRQEFGRVLMQS